MQANVITQLLIACWNNGICLRYVGNEKLFWKWPLCIIRRMYFSSSHFSVAYILNCRSKFCSPFLSSLYMKSFEYLHCFHHEIFWKKKKKKKISIKLTSEKFVCFLFKHNKAMTSKFYFYINQIYSNLLVLHN